MMQQTIKLLVQLIKQRLRQSFNAEYQHWAAGNAGHFVLININQKNAASYNLT